MQESLKVLREHSSFVGAGVFYGFPKCCIENFCFNFGFHDACVICKKLNSAMCNYPTEKKGKYCDDCALPIMINLKRSIKGNYTGFLPCHKCAKSIGMDKTKVKQLIVNRLAEGKFPNAGKKDLEFRDIFLLELVSVAKSKNRNQDLRYNLRKRKRIQYA